MDLLFVPKVLVPVMAVAAALAFVGYLARHRWGGGRWAVLLATAAGVLIGHRALLNEWPTPGSVEAAARVTLAGVATAAAAVALSSRRVPGWMPVAFAMAAATAIVGWVLAGYPTPPGASRSDFTFDHWTIATMNAFLLVILLEPIAVRTSSAGAAWACGCVAAGLGLMELFSAYSKPGMLTAAVGATIGGTFVASAFGRSPRLDRGPIAVWAVLLATLLEANSVGGGGEWQLRPVGVLALTPIVAWVGEVGPIRRWRPWQRELLRGAVVAVPVVIAVVMIVRHHAAEAAENGGY